MGRDRVHCGMCSYGGRDERPAEKFAVWLFGRGWLVDTCGHEAAAEGRLYQATWFASYDEARAALLSLNADPDDVGAVVTL